MKESLNEVMPKKYAIIDIETGIAILEFNDYSLAVKELEKLKAQGKTKIEIKENK